MEIEEIKKEETKSSTFQDIAKIQSANIKKLPEKVVVKKIKKKKVVTYKATYLGPYPEVMITPRVGKIARGKPFGVDKNMADSFRLDKNFKVEEIVKFV